MMKNIKRIFIWLLTIAIFFYGAGVLIVNLYGKDFVDRFIARITDRPVYIQKVNYGFPFGIKIYKTEMIDRFSARKIKIQFNPASLLKKEKEIAAILIYDAKLMIPENFKLGNFKGRLKIKRVLIHNGTIIVYDKENIQNHLYELKDSFIKIYDLNFPLENDVSFNFESELISYIFPKTRKSVLGGGWVNFRDKSQSATIELKNEKEETILSATLNSLNNDMTVEGEAVIGDLLSLLKRDEIKFNGQSVVDKLLSQNMSILTRFSFETKMDDFKVEKIQFEGSIDSKNVDE